MVTWTTGRSRRSLSILHVSPTRDDEAEFEEGGVELAGHVD